MSTLAERMKKALLVSGISQQELAKACGVTHSSVSFWVSGKTKALKAESANKAAACLGVSPRWLAEGVGEMKTNPEAYDDEDFSEEDEAFVSIPVYEARLSAGHCGMPTYDEVTTPRPILRIGRGFSLLRSQPGCLRDLHDLSEHLERTFLSAGRVAPPPSVF